MQLVRRRGDAELRGDGGVVRFEENEGEGDRGTRSGDVYVDDGALADAANAAADLMPEGYGCRVLGRFMASGIYY